MAERLTTDNPKNNTETMLNYAYAKDKQVYLRYGDGEEDIDLCEYISRLAADKSCHPTPEEVLDGECMECDCELSILYWVAVQAAELRGRLAKYEDLGSVEELVEIKEAAISGLEMCKILMAIKELKQLKQQICQAEKAGRVVVLPKETYQPLFVKSDALAIFDNWNDVTGAIPKGTSWYYEVQAVIEEVAAMAFGTGIFYQAEQSQAQATLEMEGK